MYLFFLMACGDTILLAESFIRVCRSVLPGLDFRSRLCADPEN